MNRADIAQTVTDKLLEMMETHGTNWKRPWVGDGLAFNVATKLPYRGANVFLLGCTGRVSRAWGTYRQWSELGAQVCKGEKATKIVFWKPVAYRHEEADEPGEAKTGLIAREYAVFNVEQVENAPPIKIEPRTAPERHAGCEDVIAMTGTRIDHRGDRAFYSSQLDQIILPKQENFISAEGYYGTAFHELTHWTGKDGRLGRDLKGRFGDEAYVFEELIAETGSALLCAMTGISPEPRPDHASYMNSWMRVLAKDKRAIFTAFSMAQKAADYIMPPPNPEPEPSRPGATAKPVAPGEAVPS